jgi:hypothetical protein
MLHQSSPEFVAMVHGDIGLDPRPDTRPDTRPEPGHEPGHEPRRDADRDADPDADPDAWADAVVLRLVQRGRSSTAWLEASSEEGRSLHFLISAESAGRLARAMTALLEVL